MKHAIGDHLLTFRNSFVFLNSIGHYFNVINVDLVRIQEATVGVQGYGLLDVPGSIVCLIRTPVIVRPRISDTA